MMPMRSHKKSASTMLCVVKTTALPAIVALIRFHKFLWDTGSKPADGSSSNTICGSPMSAHAPQSLRFMPPERRPAGLSAWFKSSTRANVAATASSTSLSSIRSLANNLKWSAQLSASHSVLCWFTTAKCLDACAKDESTDVPEMATSPLVGSTARMTADMVVVLPAPFAPNNPKTSPVRTPKVHPRTASTARCPCLLGGKTLRISLTLRPYLSSGAASIFMRGA
mmetsp:Transcript_6902/g.17683  ORF Transcript_6902/g.17683 Transcript_6902/m.17683 type:complete len:225 (+) Transcript_6902:718-1392(+)